ncbi:MAG: transporter [Saprospiraceae bacterium]|nr:transporter [Saprospiraceae bacterium]
MSTSRYLSWGTILVLLLCSLCLTTVQAQADSLQTEVGEEGLKKVELTGYLKNMQTIIAIDSINPLMKDEVLLDNLIHNRLNLNWYISDKFTFSAALRNRIFMGESVKLINSNGGNYSESLDTNNVRLFDPNYQFSWRDLSGLSFTWLNTKSAVIHSKIDRLYLAYNTEKWSISLGRQRINWGVSSLWNPNDIFNAFSFTDFDYEERPGTDALLIRYYTGYTSSIEFAVNTFDDWRRMKSAFLFKFNKWNYDFQVLAGISEQNLVAGGAWVGSIGTVGIDGEFSYFYDLDSAATRRHSFAATLGTSYMFSNSLVVSGGFLYNSNGVMSGSASGLFDFQLSAKILYPYRYAISTAISYPFSPAFSGILSAVYSPNESHALFLSPMLTYSIQDNWDFDLVGQITFSKENGRYKSPLQAFFLRLKFSFASN